MNVYNLHKNAFENVILVNVIDDFFFAKKLLLLATQM